MHENAACFGNESDYAAAMAYAPRGVVCMITEARYCGLTNHLPDAVNIATEKDIKVSVS